MIRSVDDFNRKYLEIHTKKENLFWTTYMGVEKDETALEKAESEYKSYISDPKRLAEAREGLKSAKTDGERTAWKGWENFFKAHTIENPAAEKLQKELIELESDIFKKRAQLKLHYTDKDGQKKEASSVALRSNISAADNENVRKTSHEALLQLEQWVLANGFINLVRKRNEFARAQGYHNYFEYRVQKNERMTTEELFTILDEFEKLTRKTCMDHLAKLAKEKGPQALLGHNLCFAAAGDAEKKLDSYFPFEKSLEQWSRSFAKLGISYRKATLHLDLFDRKGKYENGFMHGPVCCYSDQSGRWNPARINFTSNATPNQVGSGRRGLGTFFHEGGHAAHFSNITMNAPCFSQEYPPTSMAYAETQSMFCDSLINDGDWLKLYAKDLQGNTIPEELIRLFVTSDHPFMPFQERAILVVPIFESKLYSMKDDEMTPEAITRLVRQCEKEIQGVDCAPRPILSIPHLLGGESACSYQGYLLANMAVYQTRDHFIRKYGYLTDNPHIGPDLARYYWNPGNSLSHNETIRNLTGERLSGKALAGFCNIDNDALWRMTQQTIRSAQERSKNQMKAEQPGTVDLDAEIHIVHGTEEIANNLKSMPLMWSDFEKWVTQHYPR